MDLNAERALLIKQLEMIEDISILKAIRTLLQYNLQNEGRITVDEYNKELDKADEEINRGLFTSHEDVKKQMKNW